MICYGSEPESVWEDVATTAEESKLKSYFHLVAAADTMMLAGIANFVEMTAEILVDVVPIEGPQGIPFVVVVVVVEVVAAAAVFEGAAVAAAAPVSFDEKLVAIVGSASTFAATSVKKLVEPDYGLVDLSGKGYSAVP